MRLDTFRSVGRKALGEGDDKKAFVDPREDERVILEIKKDGTGEKYSPRLLKGAFYLNKIAHLLIPNSVPEMYQASESLDGQQMFDRERIAHTPAHKRLQMDRRSGRDEERSKTRMEREMGSEMQEVDLELERIGLGFSIDPNVANYSSDKAGNVRYLETFMPWGKPGGRVPATPELLFDYQEPRGRASGYDPAVAWD